MSNRHPRDPTAMHYAATRLGEIVGREEMELRDAADTIAVWCKKPHGVDARGLETRLNWTMREHAEATARARRNAETAIRWAIRPLIANGTKAQIEEAAGKANGDVLTWDEIIPILKEEWRAVHRRRR